MLFFGFSDSRSKAQLFLRHSKAQVGIRKCVRLHLQLCLKQLVSNKYQNFIDYFLLMYRQGCSNNWIRPSIGVKRYRMIFQFYICLCSSKFDEARASFIRHKTCSWQITCIVTFVHNHATE